MLLLYVPGIFLYGFHFVLLLAGLCFPFFFSLLVLLEFLSHYILKHVWLGYLGFPVNFLINHLLLTRLPIRLNMRVYVSP